ncbi:MAG TPA: FRG domain-containing protein [Massilibacterium sp.]|nr:FRG domain-containing protein [Massilibacterium sp.]
MFQPSFLSFLQEVATFTQKVENGNAWFRGQHHFQKEEALHSGLFRMNQKTIDDLIKWEQKAYQEFLYNGLQLHQLSSWELLFTMQHYGVKTRLLDWTESFLTALYFVVEGWEDEKGKDAVLWMLDPYRLNEAHPFLKKRKLYTPNDLVQIFKYDYPDCLQKSFINSIALFPKRHVDRITVQKSVFTLQANKVPLEKEYDGALLQCEILKKMVLPFQMAPDVKRFLSLCGIDSFVIYPDLMGLAKKVNQIK